MCEELLDQHNIHSLGHIRSQGNNTSKFLTCYGERFYPGCDHIHLQEYKFGMNEHGVSH